MNGPSPFHIREKSPEQQNLMKLYQTPSQGTIRRRRNNKKNQRKHLCQMRFGEQS